MSRRAVIGVVSLTWAALAALAVSAALGLRINVTSSMPQGFWLERPYTGAVRAGEAVAVCLPATEQARRYIGPGICPNGLEPLLKTVGAVTGDIVQIDLSGVTVNGIPLRDTASMAHDGAGRVLTPYPAGVYLVAPGQVFLFSSHDPAVYDSRYFGPVETTAIIATGKPVLTLK